VRGQKGVRVREGLFPFPQRGCAGRGGRESQTKELPSKTATQSVSLHPTQKPKNRPVRVTVLHMGAEKSQLKAAGCSFLLPGYAPFPCTSFPVFPMGSAETPRGKLVTSKGP
jgi:hypothetical protein